MSHRVVNGPYVLSPESLGYVSEREYTLTLNNKAIFVQIYIYNPVNILSNMLKKGVAISICLLVSINFIIFIPDHSSAISSPVMEIRWAKGQEVQEVDVRSVSDGLVTFSGTVSADIACGPSLVIETELWGSTDHGWPVNLTPKKMVLSGGWEEKALSATVQVTLGLDINESGLLTVGGLATVHPGGYIINIPKITGKILIKQYYQYCLTSYQPSRQAVIGDRLDLNLSINNIGNGIDRLKLDLENSNQLKNKNIRVQYSNEFEVHSKYTEESDILLDISDIAKPGKYKLKYSLVSIKNIMFENITQKSNFTFIIFVKDNYYYPLSISFILVSIMILVALFYRKIKRKKNIMILKYRQIDRSISKNPPLSIKPGSKDPFKW
jgi:hypothetical protein